MQVTAVYNCKNEQELTVLLRNVRLYFLQEKAYLDKGREMFLLADMSQQL